MRVNQSKCKKLTRNIYCICSAADAVLALFVFSCTVGIVKEKHNNYLCGCMVIMAVKGVVCGIMHVCVNHLDLAPSKMVAIVVRVVVLLVLCEVFVLRCVVGISLQVLSVDQMLNA